jgi:hypothetical protein
MSPKAMMKNAQKSMMNSMNKENNMRHFELVNSKTKSITLMPADAIKNMELKALASELDLYQSLTRGIVTITRIG